MLPRMPPLRCRQDVAVPWLSLLVAAGFTLHVLAVEESRGIVLAENLVESQSDVSQTEMDEAMQRWEEKRKTLPADWEEQHVAKWRANYARHLQIGQQPDRAASNECLLHGAKQGANLTTCCERLVNEATDACMAYEAFGFTSITCRAWKVEIHTMCYRYCGHCNKTAETVFDICKFSLGVLGDGKIINKHCQSTKEEYQLYRCPSCCEVPDFVCFDDMADECMAECGNYAPCHCRYRRNTLYPDRCFGNPINHGPIPDRPWENYTCGYPVNAPFACRPFRKEGLKCAKHRWCAPNLCIIDKVKCVPPDQCLDAGVCKPDEGLCFYSDRPNGYPCNDEIEYTVRDVCIKGICQGEPDYCLKYNVSCKPVSDCLTGGVCQISSGRCTYDVLADDSWCDDGRMYTVEDRCEKGFCLGRAVDLCKETGIKCRSPNSCMVPGECDAQTGLCSLPFPLSNQSCDDGDPTTENDTCIDGLCLGAPPQTEFLTLGDGECSDRDSLRMPRYIGDTQTEEECADTCLEDNQCRAFNYAYPSCSIWGTARNRAPMGGRPWAYIGGSVPIIAVQIETSAPVKPGQRAGVCRLKSEKSNVRIEMGEDKVEANLVFSTRPMVLFFVSILFCASLLPIGKCVRICLCGPRKSEMQIVRMDSSASVTDLRLTSGSSGDAMPPESPAHGGGISAVAALSDGIPNASPGLESSMGSSESDNDVPLPPRPPNALDDEPPLPPQCLAPSYMEADGDADTPEMPSLGQLEGFSPGMMQEKPKGGWKRQLGRSSGSSEKPHGVAPGEVNNSMSSAGNPVNMAYSLAGPGALT